MTTHIWEVIYNKYSGGVQQLGRIYQICGTNEQNALVAFGQMFHEDTEIDVVSIKFIK